METQASAGRRAGAKVRVAAPTGTLPPVAALMSTAPAGGPRAPRASKDWMIEDSVGADPAADPTAGGAAGVVSGTMPASLPVVPAAAAPAAPATSTGPLGATGSSAAAGASVTLR